MNNDAQQNGRKSGGWFEYEYAFAPEVPALWLWRPGALPLTSGNGRVDGTLKRGLVTTVFSSYYFDTTYAFNRPPPRLLLATLMW